MGLKYPVVCAWCAAEGRETVIGTTSVAGSHGICRACRATLTAEVHAKRGAR